MPVPPGDQEAFERLLQKYCAVRTAANGAPNDPAHGRPKKTLVWLVAGLVLVPVCLVGLSVLFWMLGQTQFAKIAFDWDPAWTMVEIRAAGPLSVVHSSKYDIVSRPHQMALPHGNYLFTATFEREGKRREVKTNATLGPSDAFFDFGDALRQQPKAARDVSAAELKGDATEVARIKLQSAEDELGGVKARHEAGVATVEEYARAKAARDVAAAELKGDFAEVARIKLQSAEDELRVVKARHEAGKATMVEYTRAKAARDAAGVSAGQTRGKETGDANATQEGAGRVAQPSERPMADGKGLDE